MADEQEQREPTAEEKYAPKLPKQVQDQVDAVNQAIINAAEPEQPDEEDDGGDDQYEEPDQDEEAAPDQEFPQPHTPAAEETWEQRARSSQGRLDQALNANMQLSRRVGELEQQIATLRVRGAEQPAPQAPAARQKLIKPEELNDYGEEFFDVVGRKRQGGIYADARDVRRADQAAGRRAAGGRQGRRADHRNVGSTIPFTTRCRIGRR